MEKPPAPSNTQPRRCRLPLTDQAKLEGEAPKLCYQDNCQGCTVWNLLQKQQVREAIAKWLYTTVVKERRGVKMIPWGELSESIRLDWENEADQILNLTHPSGDPMLAILDPNQDGDALAESISTFMESVPEDDDWSSLDMAQTLLRAGWRKTIP